MTRAELIAYISNCILFNKVVTEYDSVYQRISRSSFYEENLLNSVLINGLYVKIDSKNNIHLVYYDGEYEELDLGDCIDIIDSYAFAYKMIGVREWSERMYHPERQNLVSITGKSVKRIGICSFATSHIVNVNFPNVRTIGVGCFRHSKVENIVFNKLKVIPNTAFKSCNLKSFEGKKVERVGSFAFQDCKNLTSVSLPKMATINPTAFEDCSKLISNRK